MTTLDLIVDTETSGLPKSGHAIQPGQARICQIAMMLVTDTGKNVAQFSTMIRPDGWVINPEASKIHGLTTEDCARHGVPMSMALYFFDAWANQAQQVVAHNIDFDWRLMWIEHMYAAQRFTDKRWFCTMENTRDIVKCPPTEAMLRAGRTGFKSPNLGESFRHFYNKELDKSKQHDALYDVRACLSVYQALKRHNEQADKIAQTGPVDWEARENAEAAE